MTYGCKDRAPYVSPIPAQDGHYMDGYTRTPRMVSMPFRMSPDCNYTTTDLGEKDKKCQGCMHSKVLLTNQKEMTMDENQQAPQREMSFGEKAVGLTFNPSGDDKVAKCKKEFADVIDRMNYLRDQTDNPEVKRMASVAITEAQTAQMWAVKALTWRS